MSASVEIEVTVGKIMTARTIVPARRLWPDPLDLNCEMNGTNTVRPMNP